MSYDNALKIAANSTAGISQWEWIANPGWIRMRARSGERAEDTYLRLYEEYKLDFGAAGAVMELGMGHAKPPLQNMTSEYIYDFDPEHPPEGVELDYVVSLGIHPSSSVEQMAEFFYGKWNAEQKLMGDRSLVPGGHYHQILHYFSTTFDFEPTIFAAFDEPERFRYVIERFARLTLKVNEAWAMTGIKMMLCHDDIAMSDRTIFSPEWYRSEVFPYYKTIWEPFRRKNIPILFMSDGKIDEVAGDIAALSPAGIFVDEPCDLAAVSSACGPDIFLLGNVRRAALLSGGEAAIRRELERVLAESAGTNNIVLRVSSGIDETIDPAAVEAYMNLTYELRQGQTGVKRG